MDGYFVDRKDEDGLPSENYKPLVGDNKVRRLFRKGYVQNIEIANRRTEICFSADCIPDMKNEKPYFLRLIVRCVSIQEKVRRSPKASSEM